MHDLWSDNHHDHAVTAYDGYASTTVEAIPDPAIPGHYTVTVDVLTVGSVTARAVLTGLFGGEPIDGYVVSSTSEPGVYPTALAAALHLAATLAGVCEVLAEVREAYGSSSTIGSHTTVTGP